MKDFGWHLMAVALCAGCLLMNSALSHAEFPNPTATTIKAKTVQAEPVAAAPAPVIIPAPQVTVTPAPSNDFFNYIWTGLGTVFTLIFGKAAFFPPGTKIKGITLTPELRALIDQAAISAVQTGLPGKAIVAGAGSIPGVGGLAGLGEPMLRQLVLEGLQARLAQNQGTLTGTVIQPTQNPVAPQPDNLAALAEMVADKIKTRIGFPSS